MSCSDFVAVNIEKTQKKAEERRATTARKVTQRFITTRKLVAI